MKVIHHIKYKISSNSLIVINLSQSNITFLSPYSNILRCHFHTYLLGLCCYKLTKSCNSFVMGGSYSRVTSLAVSLWSCSCGDDCRSKLNGRRCVEKVTILKFPGVDCIKEGCPPKKTALPEGGAN